MSYSLSMNYLAHVHCLYLSNIETWVLPKLFPFDLVFPFIGLCINRGKVDLRLLQTKTYKSDPDY